jgi:hypothetical protein
MLARAKPLGSRVARVFPGTALSWTVYLTRMSADNLLIYGVGGLIAPFIGIKPIDALPAAPHLAFTGGQIEPLSFAPQT